MAYSPTSAGALRCCSRSVWRVLLLITCMLICGVLLGCAVQTEVDTSHRTDVSSGYVTGGCDVLAQQSPRMMQTVRQLAQPLQGKIIVLDPGHQRHANMDDEQIGPGSSTVKPKVTSGTRGVSTGVYEYELNLTMAQKLQVAFEQRGATVYSTRTSHDVDISNKTRAQQANEWKADLVIRIHADGGPTGSEHGFLTLIPQNNQWCAPIYQASRHAGIAIQEACVRHTGAHDRGVQERADLTGFNWSTVPVVLVEMGYMTTPDEDQLLQTDEYQHKIVEGIVEGTITALANAPS